MALGTCYYVKYFIYLFPELINLERHQINNFVSQLVCICMQLGVVLIFTLVLVSVVYHDSASKECKRKLAEAYALNQKLNGQLSQEDLDNLRRKLEQDEEDPEPNIRRQRQKVGHLT